LVAGFSILRTVARSSFDRTATSSTTRREQLLDVLARRGDIDTTTTGRLGTTLTVGTTFQLLTVPLPRS
jgi:hypothetical protein